MVIIQLLIHNIKNFVDLNYLPIETMIIIDF